MTKLNIKIFTKLKKSRQDSKTPKLGQNSKTLTLTKLKKNQIVTKRNLNCDKSQQIKLLQTQEPKMWQISNNFHCDKS